MVAPRPILSAAGMRAAEEAAIAAGTAMRVLRLSKPEVAHGLLG